MITDRDAAIIGGLTDFLNFRAVALELLCDAISSIDAASHIPRLVFGYRSPLEQRRLFEQGRELLDPEHPDRYTSWKPNSKRGRIVTRSLPADSAHCYGAAIDLALIDRISRQWMPDGHPAWNWLADLAEKHGLASGHRWPSFRDSAHIELRDWQGFVRRGELKLIG